MFKLDNLPRGTQRNINKHIYCVGKDKQMHRIPSDNIFSFQVLSILLLVFFFFEQMMYRYIDYHLQS